MLRDSGDTANGRGGEGAASAAEGGGGGGGASLSEASTSGSSTTMGVFDGRPPSLEGRADAEGG